ncbi:hypothetical protein C3L33_08741, partial [Rhododendron williamsianum]
MRSAVEEVENDQVSNRVMTRSTSNQKKFMDDYANRRMTRSAFKQQQEQKGDEKPQQQKKRKRENKKKKPVVDDTPKISWRHVRYFTPEEREAYQKKLKESEGFDVGKYTSEVALSNPISEISLEEPSFGRDFSTEAAKMAIRDYNRKKLPRHAVDDPELVASHYRRLALLLNPHRNRLPSAGGKTTNRAQTASASENNNETTMTSLRGGRETLESCTGEEAVVLGFCTTEMVKREWIERGPPRSWLPSSSDQIEILVCLHKASRKTAKVNEDGVIFGSLLKMGLKRDEFDM